MNLPVPRQPLRIGILSFAHYHANYWAEVFVVTASLAGIWDDNPTRGSKAAQRLGTRYFDNVDELLGHCDAVAVCSETARHLALIERAAQRGLPVLVEKPLAASVADAMRIGEICQDSNLVLMQSFPKRQDPISHWIKNSIDSGEFGKISLVRIRHGHYYGLAEEFKSGWFVHPELSGGGALLDEGIHGIDLLTWIFGMPRVVSAIISSEALGLRVEDLGIATFVYASGVVAEITASFCFAAADASIEIYGARGSILVSGIDLASRDITSGPCVRVFRRPAQGMPANPHWEIVDLTPRFKLGQFHQQSAVEFLRCLNEGTVPPATWIDGMRAVFLVDAAYRSARERRQVFIDFESE